MKRAVSWPGFTTIPAMRLIYDLHNDPQRVQRMQHQSRRGRGLRASPLVGSDEWWSAANQGDLEQREISSTVSWVGWGSMEDYPIFRVLVDKPRRSWARRGDVRLYVEDLAVRITYVLHPWAQPQSGPLGQGSVVETGIWLEESGRRSSAVAPGKDGTGYRRICEQKGDQVHYLVLPSSEARQECASAAVITGASAVQADSLFESELVRVWYRGALVSEMKDVLAPLAADHGGRYDGGEIVGESVWGPEGPQ